MDDWRTRCTRHSIMLGNCTHTLPQSTHKHQANLRKHHAMRNQRRCADCDTGGCRVGWGFSCSAHLGTGGCYSQRRLGAWRRRHTLHVWVKIHRSLKSRTLSRILPAVQSGLGSSTAGAAPVGCCGSWSRSDIGRHLAFEQPKNPPGTNS